jgi:hypothetical protein
LTQENPQECYYRSLDTPDYARENPISRVEKKSIRKYASPENYES